MSSVIEQPQVIASAGAPVPKPWVLGIAPYIPGRSAADGQDNAVKLSSNENPLGTSAMAIAAFAAHQGDLARYPDASALHLRAAIAAQYDLDPARIIYGTGSDEVLHLVAGVYAGPGDEVLYVRYGFSVYDIAARRVGATVVVVPDHNYGTDVDAILDRVGSRTRLIYIANPNNPTGTYTSQSELARLHAALPPTVMLVVDQAYAEYLEDEEDDGALDLARTQPNVIVTRTFSKIHGLAAERIGWGYGSLEAVSAMHRIRAPFCLTTAGQAAALGALDDKRFVLESRRSNREWRSWLAAEISQLSNAGLRAIPSKANFLLILFEGQITAEVVYRRLMDVGYITRWLPGQGLPHGLRVTVGTSDETQGFASALRRIVAPTD